MARAVLMGLDVGGSGARALLVDIDSGEVTSTYRSWTLPATPGTNGTGFELPLEALWSLLGEASREVMLRAGVFPDAVMGVAASAMRFGSVVLDAKGAPVFAVPNRDARAAGQAMRLAVEHGAALHACTGHWPMPIASLGRLLWLKEQQPALFSHAQHVLSISDWLAYRMCGEVAVDPTQAAASLLFDVRRRDWAWDWIDRLEFPRELFPSLREVGTQLGELGREAAASLGLRAGTPVAMGAGDTQCGLLGSGAYHSGCFAAVTGSTAPVVWVGERPLVDPDAKLWTDLHAVPDRWLVESNAGPMGESLDWLARMLAPDAPQPVARLFAESAASEPGAGGFVCNLGSQVMDGRRMQLPISELTLSHLAADSVTARGHLGRAVIEGMACALRANLEQLETLSGTRAEGLRLTGGLCQSSSWGQQVADVLRVPVETSVDSQATALGAALCAGVAGGAFPRLDDAVDALARKTRTFMPRDGTSDVYAEVYANWRRLNQAQAPVREVAAQIAIPQVLRHLDGHAAAAPLAVRPKILVTADLDKVSLAALQDLGEVEYASFREKMRLLSGSALVEALQGVQVFISEVDVIDAQVLRQLPELRAVASCRGDAVNVDLEAASAHGVPVLHAPGRNAEAVADLTLAYLLMLARKLPAATAFLRDPAVTAGDVGRMGQAFQALRGAELWRKKLGLVGFGAVGQAVARRAQAFGAGVLVSDPYLAESRANLAGVERVSLERLLEESDFISLHAAVNDETRGLIGAKELARMKSTAFLINTARAALVDEQALTEALRNEKLSGAALDVFSVEPPGAGHPLLALENVIATPHVGGNTWDVSAHQGEIIIEELTRLLRGESPHHVLNPEVMQHFSWEAARPVPSDELLTHLESRSIAAVTDLDRDALPQAGGRRRPEGDRASVAAPAEVIDAMRSLLESFTAKIAADAALQELAGDKDVTLHFTLRDLGLDFHMRLRGGRAIAALGAPDAPAEVELSMRGEILDGMFTGSLNPMQAAMNGEISFCGDTVKAMTLQHLQGDLERVYQQARGEVGAPSDLSGVPDVASSLTEVASPLAPGDIREALIATVEELYQTQLITATGGNVSVRIPDADGELWITPSQLFKGDLCPEKLVRIGLDGRPLEANAPSPSSERMLHCALYAAREGVQAVIHAHAPHATTLANAELPFVPISTEAAFFGEIPRVPFIMPGSDELAKAVAEAMDGGWAVLMKNHGLIVAGRSLRRAADMVEIIERSAQLILGCHAVGKEPPCLPDDVVAMLQQAGDLVA